MARARREKAKKIKKRGLLSGLFPKFDMLPRGKKSSKEREYTVKSLRELKHAKISELANHKSMISFKALLEHRGSSVMKVGKRETEPFPESIGLATITQVTPFTVLGSYRLHHPESGQTATNFVVIWKMERVLSQEQELLPSKKKHPQLQELAAELKRGKKTPDKSLTSLESAMINHHHAELKGRSKFGTLDIFGDMKGMFRKPTVSEKKALNKLGIKVKRNEFVFALSGAPEEDKSRAPREISEEFRARRSEK